MTNDPQKSDLLIRATKSANKPEGSGAESMEQRGRAEGNMGQTHTCRAQDRVSVTTGLDRVRERAKARKKEKFTTLLHHVDIDLLRRAYFQLKRKAAPGVDAVTWQAYGEQLEANLADLHDRVHRGAYRAPPSRRVYIEKDDGRKRPIGIASLADKVLQRAVVDVLNAVYEVDFARRGKAWSSSGCEPHLATFAPASSSRSNRGGTAIGTSPLMQKGHSVTQRVCRP